MMIFRSALRGVSTLLRLRYYLHDEEKARRSELTTYLEIIPPVETYRIVEGRSKLTQTLLTELKGKTELTKQ